MAKGKDERFNPKRRIPESKWYTSWGHMTAERQNDLIQHAYTISDSVGADVDMRLSGIKSYSDEWFEEQAKSPKKEFWENQEKRSK